MFTWAFALLLAASWASLATEATQRTDMQLKAEHILKFAHYVEWPANAFGDATSPIVIGVMGAPALADELERISQSQQIAGRPVSVKNITADNAPDPVHILFLGTQPGSKSGKQPTSAATRPRLSVCDTSHDHAHACAIKFVQDSHRLRFDISLPAAEQAGIRIMAPLLTVARRVQE